MLNIDEQSAAISDALYKAMTGIGNTATIDELRAELDTLGEYGGEYTNTYETMILELEELSELRKRYKKAKVDIENTVPHKFVLTHGSPSEKKAYPIRWLIVLGTVALAFFTTIIVVLVRNQINQIRTIKAE